MQPPYVPRPASPNVNAAPPATPYYGDIGSDFPSAAPAPEAGSTLPTEAPAYEPGQPGPAVNTANTPPPPELPLMVAETIPPRPAPDARYLGSPLVGATDLPRVAEKGELAVPGTGTVEALGGVAAGKPAASGETEQQAPRPSETAIAPETGAAQDQSQPPVEVLTGEVLPPQNQPEVDERAQGNPPPQPQTARAASEPLSPTASGKHKDAPPSPPYVAPAQAEPAPSTPRHESVQQAASPRAAAASESVTPNRPPAEPLPSVVPEPVVDKHRGETVSSAEMAEDMQGSELVEMRRNPRGWVPGDDPESGYVSDPPGRRGPLHTTITTLPPKSGQNYTPPPKWAQITKAAGKVVAAPLLIAATPLLSIFTSLPSKTASLQADGYYLAVKVGTSLQKVKVGSPNPGFFDRLIARAKATAGVFIAN